MNKKKKQKSQTRADWDMNNLWLTFWQRGENKKTLTEPSRWFFICFIRCVSLFVLCFTVGKWHQTLTFIRVWGLCTAGGKLGTRHMADNLYFNSEILICKIRLINERLPRRICITSRSSKETTICVKHMEVFNIFSKASNILNQLNTPCEIPRNNTWI